MRSFLFALSALPLVALASSPFTKSHRRRHSTIKARTAYGIVNKYQGEDFINEWDFFSDADPTHGRVEYLTREDAVSNNLAYVQEDGTTILAVDNTTTLAVGENRKSVRISSPKAYSTGLFVADIWAMPHGCGTWPAYWSVGPDWPNGGEIDVIEGVHKQETNQMAVHTSTGCSIASTLTDVANVAKAALFHTECASSGDDNTGCGFRDTDNRTYGHGFNMGAGGVYAHEIASSGVSVWYFPRDEIPADLASETPDPSTWGTPNGFWPSDSCDIASHFYDHSLIFDITLCGDWGEGAYESSGCPGTCADAVADPTNFKRAQFKINYVAVYQ